MTMTDFVKTMVESNNEKDVMFSQVCDVLTRLDNPYEVFNNAIDQFANKDADIDCVRACLECTLSLGAFIPMHVFTVAAEVAMCAGPEARRGIRNAVLPVYWLYGIADPK